MRTTIELHVPLKGIAKGRSKVTMQTQGFQGETCVLGGAFLQNALGVVEADTPTSEMYETEQRHEHLNEGGN